MFIHMSKVTNGYDEWHRHTDCHPAVLSGKKVFMANFGLILSVMLILKVLMEFIHISGVIVQTNRTHQTHLIVDLE